MLPSQLHVRSPERLALHGLFVARGFQPSVTFAESFMSNARPLWRTASAAALAIVLLQPTVAQSKRAMTIDDVLNLVQVSSPRISPDGTRVLYTVSELAKWKDNKRTTAVWMANADGSNARRFLGHEKDRDAAWSPDGKYVAFLSTRDAGDSKADSPEGSDNAAQIYVIPVDGGEATKLTDHKGKIKSFEWMKDSASIMFLAERA